MFYIYTLDSHEWYGPFKTHARALRFGERHGLLSFQIVGKLPAYVSAYEVRKAWYGKGG